MLPYIAAPWILWVGDPPCMEPPIYYPYFFGLCRLRIGQGQSFGARAQKRYLYGITSIRMKGLEKGHFHHRYIMIY